MVSGVATEEDKEERNTLKWPNAAADEPRGQRGGGGGGRSLGGRGHKPIRGVGWQSAGQLRPAAASSKPNLIHICQFILLLSVKGRVDWPSVPLFHVWSGASSLRPSWVELG